MQIIEIDTPGRNLITALDPDRITVNGVAYRHSLLLHPKAVFPDWPITDLAQLRLHHLDPLRDHAVEIVLVGTGRQQRFPEPAQWRTLRTQAWGLEIMTTAAACRTYNLIAAEGRAVAAALILEPLT